MNLIFDSSNLHYRAYSIENKEPGFDLSTPGSQNRLVRKFIIDTCYLIKQIDPDNVIYCFDGESFRKELSPIYKAKRNKIEGLDESINRIRQLLNHKGLNAVIVEGLEADDIMTLLASQYSDEPTIFISADEDIRQLVSEKCWVINVTGKEKKIYSLSNKIPFKLDNSIVIVIDPMLISTTKILKGCDGDNVLSLAPKGFRVEKVSKINDNVKQIIESSHTKPAQAYYQAIKKFMPSLTKDELQDQMDLVFLHRDFLPKNLVYNFDKVILKSNRVTEFAFDSILQNTKYFDTNYFKK